MNHQDKSNHALENARDLDKLVKSKTGYTSGIADPISDYWQFVVSDTKGYNIFPDPCSPDFYVERYDMTDRSTHRYDDPEQAFQDLKTDTAKLGLEISRLSNFGFKIRDLSEQGACYIVETEYEKDGDGDDASFTAFHKFNRIHGAENEKKKSDECRREGRTETRDGWPRRRSESCGRRYRDYVTSRPERKGIILDEY